MRKFEARIRFRSSLTRIVLCISSLLFFNACMMTSGLHDDPDAKNILDFALSTSSGSNACSQKLLSSFGYPVDPRTSNSVYSYVTNNCASCHGSTQGPRFAVQDGSAAYSVSIQYANLSNPALSKLYARSKDGHCGAPCSQSGSAMLSALQVWAAAEVAAKTDPVCVGTGIKFRVNGVTLTDQLVASQRVNSCIGYEIVSLINGGVANPASDLDIALSGAAVFSDPSCTMDILTPVKLPKTQSALMIYVMEAVAGMQTLVGSSAGSTVKIDLTFTDVIATPTPLPTLAPTSTPAPTPTRAPTPTPGGPTVTPTPIPTATPNPTPTPAGVACTTLQRQNAYKNTLWPVVKANCATCHTTGSQPQFGNANLSTAYSNALSRINKTTPTSSKIYTKGRDGHCGNACSSSMGTTLLNQINAWLPAETTNNCSSLGVLVQ